MIRLSDAPARSALRLICLRESAEYGGGRLGSLAARRNVIPERAEKGFVIPNRAEGRVRNLLFARAATNLCHSTGQQVPRALFSAHRNDKSLGMGAFTELPEDSAGPGIQT
jgi:hypothetical protein